MSEPAQVVDLFSRRPVGVERLTKRELAARLGVSGRTVERWTHDPRYRRGGRGLPVERVFEGAAVRYVWVEVEAWLAG